MLKFKCLGVAFLAVVLIFLAFLGWGFSAWPNLKSVDPSLSILNDPPRLIALIAQDNTNEQATELKSEALKRLIAGQLETYDRLAFESQNPAGIDHKYIKVVSTNQAQVRLLCTPPQAKKIEATEGAYFPIEYLTFNWNGVLVKRDPYVETTNNIPGTPR